MSNKYPSIRFELPAGAVNCSLSGTMECEARASPVQGEVSAEQADGGVDAVECIVIVLDLCEFATFYRTIPQSKPVPKRRF